MQQSCVATSSTNDLLETGIFENNLIAIDDADILFQVELQNVDYHYTKLSLLRS